MTRYLISFDQRWVGDHPEEWYVARGPLARAVVNEMKTAGVVVFAGGLEEELERAFHLNPAGDSATLVEGPVVQRHDFLGGLTVIDVADDEAAAMWAGKVAAACGWPQEVRRFKPDPLA